MSRVTRRRFFEESMIATATAVAAGSAGQVAAAEENGNADANETIRHAVIGCRIRGRVHARAFSRMPGVEVTYVCDPDRDLAHKLAEATQEHQTRKPKAVQDLREIMDDNAVDTVSVAAPNHWHALASIWAMQAGKDVYVEKPVSHNIWEGRRTVQVASETGRICQAGTQRRSSTALAAAAQYIHEGKLGKVDFARSIIYGKRASIGKPGTYNIPPQVDYNLWAGPAPMSALTRPQFHYDWHWFWATGNGELGNNNIHIVDVCRWLMGLSGLGSSVISIGGRLGYEDAGQSPNTQIVAHDFGGRTIVQEVRGLASDPFSKLFRAGWVIRGTEGFIAESSLFDPDGKLIKKFDGKEENHFANFISAVRNRNREELNADIREGHQSSGLCHVGNISYRLGRCESAAEIAAHLEKQDLHPDVAKTFHRMTEHLKSNNVDLKTTKLTLGPILQIDSANERFVDNPGANALLTRTYRKPFVVPGGRAV